MGTSANVCERKRRATSTTSNVQKLFTHFDHYGNVDTHLSTFNRDLSWLEFNERVLSLGEDSTVPELERLAFYAIFGTNLDEFFQVRVAGLHDQIHARRQAKHSGLGESTNLMVSIHARVEELVRRQSRGLRELFDLLREHNIEVVSVDELSPDEELKIRELFNTRIYPVLTPLAVDPAHPFPYISNLSLNLAVTVSDVPTAPTEADHSDKADFETPSDSETERETDREPRVRFARLKVPSSLPRFVRVSSAHRYVLLEDLIANYVGDLFPGMQLESVHPFRVTRNADIDLDGHDATDLLMAVETELQRRRFGRAIRLEIPSQMPAETLSLLLDELELDQSDVTTTDSPLGLGSLWSIARIDRPEMRFPAWTPVSPRRLLGPDTESIFESIRANDILVHHPYDSFAASVERFIEEAANDPKVLAIKITLYRTSGDGRIVESLIRAVKAGKQVAVLVELKARFDEQANIGWARKMEEAGVHVVYGFLGLKTHTKIALVVRDEGDVLRRYSHVATGNYNATTARIYEDLGMFSCDEELAEDLTRLFNALTGYGSPKSYARLLVAPDHLRDPLFALIEGEYPTADRGPGRIVMKMNSLEDPEIIEALYAASRAGVEVDLIVRGICCLVPGVPGQSETIRVRSILGRYLEHSRVFYFANGKGTDDPVWLLGSADLMQRNLDQRIEALVKVTDPNIVSELRRLLALLLHPDLRCWMLQSDGRWTRTPTTETTTEPVDPHHELQIRTWARNMGD